MNINNVFWTFQGEGAHAGRRALFVRMPFCNLLCPWCDTEFNSYKTWEEADFLKACAAERGRLAVITGGEPSMNKDTSKVIALLKQSLFNCIAIETNGNFPVPDGIDFVTVSPKKYTTDWKVKTKLPPYYIDSRAFDQASEFKYVVEEDFDFSILDRHDTNDGRRYSLSPEFTIFEKSLGRIFEYIKEHPEWRISLQTHKWMNVP